MVEYKYNAWGTQLSRTGELANTLGYANPFRYRGYIYDDETWMYWLRSRYYYPELHRFISADNVMDGAGLFSANLYAYCKNAPVGASDPSGHFEISYSEDRAAPNWRPIGGSMGDRIIGSIIGSLLYVSLRRITKVVSKAKTITSVRVTPDPSATPSLSPSPEVTPNPNAKYRLAVAFGVSAPIPLGNAMEAGEIWFLLALGNRMDIFRKAMEAASIHGVPVAYGAYTPNEEDARELASWFGSFVRHDVGSGLKYPHYHGTMSGNDDLHFWYAP